MCGFPARSAEAVAPAPVVNDDRGVPEKLVVGKRTDLD